MFYLPVYISIFNSFQRHLVRIFSFSVNLQFLFVYLFICTFCPSLKRIEYQGVNNHSGGTIYLSSCKINLTEISPHVVKIAKFWAKKLL